MAEFAGDATVRQDSSQKALVAYETATRMASTILLKSHPILLGLALNFSIYYYEILNDTKKACAITKRAIDDSTGVDSTMLSENESKDSTLLLQLLQGNIDLWTIGMVDKETFGDDDEKKLK